MTSQQPRDTRLLTAARDTEEQPHCWLEFKPLSSLQTHCGPKSNNLTVGCSSNLCPHYKHTVDQSLTTSLLVVVQTSVLTTNTLWTKVSWCTCYSRPLAVNCGRQYSVCVSSVMLTVQCTSSQSLYITWSVCVCVISHVDCTVYIITVTVYNVVSVSLSSVMLTVQCTSSQSLYITWSVCVISHVDCTVYIITVTVYNVVSVCHQSC